MATTNRKEVYTIVEREGAEKAWWVRVGTAFENKDGSFSIFLDALPGNGKLHMRDPKERDDSDDNKGKQAERSRRK